MNFNIILIIIFFVSSFKLNAQEKGGILIGVTNANETNTVIQHSSIKDNLINHFGDYITKAEICPSHSLIYLVVNVNKTNILTNSDIISYLEQTYPNLKFWDKYLHQKIDDLNCKWK